MRCFGSASRGHPPDFHIDFPLGKNYDGFGDPGNPWDPDSSDSLSFAGIEMATWKNVHVANVLLYEIQLGPNQQKKSLKKKIDTWFVLFMDQYSDSILESAWEFLTSKFPTLGCWHADFSIIAAARDLEIFRYQNVWI